MRIKKAEIEKILSNWNLPKVTSIEKAELGVVNHNWIIKTKNKRYVLRKVVGYKKLSDTQFELNYLKILKGKKFPYKIPIPIPTNKNKLLVRNQKMSYWLYEYLDGKTISKITKPMLKEIAIMLSSYHKILEKTKFHNHKRDAKPYHRDEIIKELNNFDKKLINKTKLNKADHIFMKESKNLKKILLSLPTKTYDLLKKYPLHRDPNPENLLWKKGKLIGVIDFDNVSSTKDIFLREIGVALQQCCHNKKYEIILPQAKYLLKQYLEKRTLSKNEIELLPDIIAGVYIEDFSYAYWLLENDPKRGKTIWLEENAYPAKWYFKNRDKIIKELIK